jgi:mono/diheme cytochrome c family protein
VTTGETTTRRLTTMRLTVRRTILAVVAVGVAAALAGGGSAILAGQTEPPSVFTAEQATAGKAAYGRSCAGCHMPDLGGTPDAPPLAGSRFVDSWRTRTTKELFDFVSGAMPPGGSSMRPDTYAEILAYMFQSNGAPPGTTRFEPSTALPLDRVVGTGVTSR